MEWRDVVRELKVGPSELERAVLDVDLSSIARASGPPALAMGIDLLQEATEARTIRELLDEPDVGSLLSEALPRAERRAFLRAMPVVARRLARQSAARASAPSAAPLPPRPSDRRRHDADCVPPGGDELDAWADNFAVGELLETSIQFRVEGLGRGSSRIPPMTLRECVDVVRYPDTGRAWGLPRDAIRDAAQKELRAKAQRNAPHLSLRTTFLARRRPSADGWIADRARLLAELAARAAPTRVHPAPLELTYPMATVDFVPNPPRLHVRGLMRADESSIDLATGAVTNTGPYWHGSPERLREDRALLMCGADALSDPAGAAHSALVAWRAIPAWHHMLNAFDEVLRRRRPKGDELHAEAEERVAYRLSVDAIAAPNILLQRSRRGGSGFTLGRQVQVHEALALPNLTTLEREALETIELLGPAGTLGRREHVRTRLRLLELLADHPRVYLEADAKTPVCLRRARVSLGFAAEDERSYRVHVTLGPAALTIAQAADRARTAGILWGVDAPGTTVYFGEVDDVSTALFFALAAFGDTLAVEGLSALFDKLSAFPGLAVDLELPDELRGKPVDPDARVIVQLSTRPGGALAVSLRVRPLPDGPTMAPGAPPRHAYGIAPDRARVFAMRDLDDEQARAEHVLAELPLSDAVRRGPFDVRIDDPVRAGDVLATLAELGDTIVVEWPEGKPVRVAATLGPSALRLRIARKRDWFDIAGGAQFEGTNIELPALLEAARAGRRFVRLDAGTLVALSRELRARLGRVADHLHEGREGVVAHAPAVGAVSSLVDDEDEQVTADAAWADLRARVRRAQSFEPSLPDGLTVRLRPYQEDGYRWLMRLAECGGGGCLADDMGLGKTLQALAVLAARRGEGPALVIAPTSVCANWLDEAARFAPALEVVGYRGPDRATFLSNLRAGKVLVTSYDLMLRDIDALASIEFATAVFDEAHALKNVHAKRAAAARRVRATFSFALTGTPIENHTGELWSLFHAILPELFGSWERFRERFGVPIERDRDPARRAALAAAVRPYLLRRTKSSVAPELPPRTEVIRFVDLSATERELYEIERLRAIDSVKAGAGREDARFAVLAALTRLRQLACHPRLRHPESAASSSKLEKILALVNELRAAGRRALVFSQFTGHLAIVAEALDASGIRYFELQGSTPAEQRAERVRRFQAGEADLFLISLKAGGVGLNLTAADTVLHLDPWWNPAAEDQASDRAHRIGQDKPVTVVRFIARGTIEEAVLALHGEKRELADALLAGGDVAGRLTTRELVSLMERGGADEEA